eukprot:TRINITY_DN1492_c0_g1_i1.p2 TRINITY_DN1492_c0_g1~~TRINITY_DN1492_c0_g1_i1.p2  ORF type:complete len:402 (+),score=188.93 TRINITY_DN1492_c0_g1_i1:108-1313(+)
MGGEQEHEEEVEYEEEYEYEEGCEPGTPPCDDGEGEAEAGEGEDLLELEITGEEGTAADAAEAEKKDPDYNYEGEMQNGKKHGKGRMAFKYGTYTGEWMNDMMAGQGRLELKTGNVYEGRFWRNKFDGEGHMTWACGKEYTGTMVNGHMTGKGRMKAKEGDYEGDFYNNEFFGRGVMTFSNGDHYNGEWRSGMMWGKGVLTTKDGATYDGNFAKNKKHGRIVRTDPVKKKEYIERYEYDVCKVSNKIKKDKKAKKEKERSAYEVDDDALPSGDHLDMDRSLDAELFHRSNLTEEDAMRALDQRARKNKRAGGYGSPAPVKAPERPHRLAMPKPESLTEKELAVREYQQTSTVAKSPTQPATSTWAQSMVDATSNPTSPNSPAPPLPTQPPPPMDHYSVFKK